MSTTEPEVVPQPVAAVEAEVVAALPEQLKPEVNLAEQEFSTVLSAVEQQGAAASPALEAADPAAAAVASDVTEIAQGKTVAPAALITAGSALVQEARRGYKTTEFWITIAGVVLAQVGAIRVPGKYGTTIQDSALIGAYVLSRGFAKSTRK